MLSFVMRAAVVGAAVLVAGMGPAFSQVVVPAGATLSVPAGGLDLGCTDLEVQGTLLVGDAQVSQSDGVAIAAGGVLDGGDGAIELSGDWNNAGSFVPGTSTVILNDTCGSGAAALNGTTTFTNLTLTSTTGKTFVIPEGASITVTGVLTLQGAPGTPIQIVSSGGQTAVINLAPGAQVVSSDAQVAANVQIGAPAATPIPTLNEWMLLLSALLVLAVAARGPAPRRRIETGIDPCSSPSTRRVPA